MGTFYKSTSNCIHLPSKLNVARIFFKPKCEELTIHIAEDKTPKTRKFFTDIFISEDHNPDLSVTMDPIQLKLGAEPIKSTPYRTSE
jgi:hypothetical protein